jgi:hypothetical protein
MSIVFPSAGREDTLKASLNITPENLILRLYRNNKTPAVGDGASQYVEANFTGYASVELIPETWEIVSGDPPVASYPRQQFQSTVNQTKQEIYGYYITGKVSGRLRCAFRFPETCTMFNNGDAIGVIISSVSLS